MSKASGRIKSSELSVFERSVKSSWSKLECLLAPYRSERQYIKAVKFVDSLLDEIGENEKHPLASLAQTIALLIEEYESREVPELEVSGIAALRFLMQERELVQKDLAFLGSQGVVSEILSGSRDLNKRQILALSEFFEVSPLVFL